MSETFDANHMRAVNSSILLKLIWQNHEISRADISRMTGMSRSTVSVIVADLMRQRLVSERGEGHSSGGRRPVILAFNEESYAALGVELTQHSIAAAITNLDGKVKHWIQRECPVVQDPQATLEHLRGILAETLSFCAQQRQPLIGIGVGLPLPIPAGSSKDTLPAKYFAEWKNHRVPELFRAEAPVPVLFENDANLGALAELWWGQGRRSRNLVYIKMGAGIGAGLIIDSKIFRGAHGFAGELGYTVFHAPELGRNYRLSDLFDRYLSVEKLAEEAGSLGMVWAESSLSRRKLNFSQLARAAQEGDALGQHALKGIGRGLGLAIANLLHLLNLDVVILGSVLPSGSADFLAEVRRSLRQHAAWTEIAETPIELSPVGEQQVPIGAATLVLERAMDNLSLFSSADGLMAGS